MPIRPSLLPAESGEIINSTQVFDFNLRQRAAVLHCWSRMLNPPSKVGLAVVIEVRHLIRPGGSDPDGLGGIVLAGRVGEVKGVMRNHVRETVVVQTSHTLKNMNRSFSASACRAPKPAGPPG